MAVPTICWEEGQCRIIDQTLLPTEYKIIELATIADVWEAIKVLRVRGAPAIGVAAAFGLYLGVKDFAGEDMAALQRLIAEQADYLASSRPTAVNLFWALERLKQLAAENAELPVAELKQRLLDEARAMIVEDDEICMAIGRHGVVFRERSVVLRLHLLMGGNGALITGPGRHPGV